MIVLNTLKYKRKIENNTVNIYIFSIFLMIYFISQYIICINIYVCNIESINQKAEIEFQQNYTFDGYDNTILLLLNSHYISICIEAISAIIIYCKDIFNFEIIKI